MNRLSRRWILPTLVVFATVMMSTPAKATLMVDIGGTVSGGVYTPGTVYEDNGPEDASPVVGVLDLGVFLNTIAINFAISGFTATSGQPIASLTMNANTNLRAAATVPFTTTLLVTDTNFAIPFSPIALSQTVSLLSSTGGPTVTATSMGFLGDSNTEFDVDNGATSAASSALAGGVATNIPGQSNVLSAPPLYSLTTYTTIEIAARGTDLLQNLQFNSNLSATGIPEPASSTLFGGGLLAIAALVHRFAKKKA